jgi:hypothetical protein
MEAMALRAESPAVSCGDGWEAQSRPRFLGGSGCGTRESISSHAASENRKIGFTILCYEARGVESESRGPKHARMNLEL